jgi:hypothetical protein
MTISDLVDAGQGYVAGYTPSASRDPSLDTADQVEATAIPLGQSIE